MKTKLNGILTLLLALVVQVAFAQQTVTGKVTDPAGDPILGATVVVSGSSNATTTDFDGNYSISASAESSLVFSFTGYTQQTIAIGNRTSINVTMSTSLDAIVVTGYSNRSQELSTSAVSTVTSEDIQNLVPSLSVDNMLQGKAAGVQVTGANGRPGQTALVQIRGLGSINASTTPLYVVDGVPIDANDVNNINPNDIETFSILKDAATVSLYGSRGANGVVLITTKQGKSGESRITLRSSIGVGSRIDDPFDLMNATQKLELERQYAALGVNAARNLPGAVSTPEQLATLISRDTDWEDALLRNSYIQSNSLSIAGGEEKLTYFLSLGYDKNSGIIDRIDGFERITARLNSTYEAKKWLTIGTNLSMARSSTDLPRDRNNVQNPFRAMYDYNPYDPLFLRDENNEIVVGPDGQNVFNPTRSGFPIARALTTELEDNRNFLIIGNLSANVKFSDHFSNRFQVGATNNRFNRTNRSLAGGTLDAIVGDANFPGNQTDNFSNELQYNVSNIFNYTDTYGEFNNLSADVLLEYNENIFTSFFATSRGFPSPDFPYQNVAAQATAAGSTESRRILFSQGLFLNYDYDGKYLATASVRRDGSSRFGPNNKYGTFYSGSLGWNLAREAFLEGTAVNNLKLRASYGTAGNQNIGDFLFLDLLGFGTYNGRTTAVPLGVGNPDIKWEGQTTFDIGVEFGFFRNRVRGVVDYYVKTSDDLLLNRPISFTVGDENNAVTSNIGKTENKGLEVTLSGDLIRNSNFTWTVGGNVSFIDNEVKELINGADINNGNTILREGEEINTYQLVRYAGVNPDNGAPQYLDLDGNITETFSAGFQTTLSGKSPLADVQGGFYTSVNYKGFGLRADFVGQSGNYINNLQRSAGISIGGIASNRRVESFNYWQNPGDTNVLPSPLFQGTADQNSTRFLEKGDYIRLRTLTVDYNMPSRILDGIVGIKSLRIYATGQNILTFTDYEGDPEIGIGSGENSAPGDAGFVAGQFSLFSYPQTKSYIVGIEIGL